MKVKSGLGVAKLAHKESRFLGYPEWLSREYRRRQRRLVIYQEAVKLVWIGVGLAFAGMVWMWFWLRGWL